MKKTLIRLLSIAAGVVAGASAQAQAEPSLRVELLIYSGRVNPAFTINDPQQVAEILNTATALPRDPQVGEAERPLPPSRLGYQGFLITNHSGTIPALKSIVVYRSAVQLAFDQGGGGAHRIDANASLERRLIDYAQRLKLVDAAALELVTGSH